MNTISADKILVSLKAYSRSTSLPLDESSVWESLEAASVYATKANAYGGQIVTALVDGKYKAYILQPSGSTHVLEEIGVGATGEPVESEVKQSVIIGTRPESGQEQGIIYIEENIGYVWNGVAWVKVFEDFTNSIDAKANIESPEFTGIATLNGSEIATQEWVNSIIGQLNTGVPGIVDQEHPFPTSDYKAGQMWRIAVAGNYAGQNCGVGDLVICLTDYNVETASDTDFMTVQANIDGAVTGADSAVDGNIVLFDGVTGKVIKDSTVSIASLNEVISVSHTHENIEVLNSFDKTQTELLTEASSDADSKVSGAKAEIEAKFNDYYTKTELDESISAINTALDGKINADGVDTKITAAKQEITTAYEEAISTTIGDLGESENVAAYVASQISSEFSGIDSQLNNNLTEAKSYTDSAMTIVEF